MKVSNGDVWLAREPLQTLMKEKLPVAVALKVARLAHKLQDESKSIEDVRNGLIKKYGEPVDQGRTAVKQDGPNWDKFVAEFNELMAQEVEIVVETIKLPAELTIEPQVLMALEKFVTG